MPDFDLLDKELKKNNDAVLLAVNMTDGKRDTESKVKSFVKDNGYGRTQRVKLPRSMT